MERKEIFQNVNFWLQFAEAKNGAMLTINGLLIFSSLDLYDKFKKLPYFSLIQAVFLVLITISLLNNFRSFFPIRKIGLIKKKSNILFWGDISKYDSSISYSKDIDQELSDINDHIEDEIFTNSKIADRKYLIFGQSLWITFTGVLLFSIYSVVIIVVKLF
jgi:hypothetical protein